MVRPPRDIALAFDTLVRVSGGAKATAEYLHVSPRSVRRWLDANDPPYAHAALLWYLSPIGERAIDLDTGARVATLGGLVLELSRRLAAAEEQLAATAPRFAANDASVQRPHVALRAADIGLHPFHVGPQPIELR
ncbi:MAG TPA: hypothetical protein VGE10_01770 [Zeimonas sp.]